MSQTHAYADILLHTIKPDRNTFLLLSMGTHSLVFFRFAGFFETILMTILVDGNGVGVVGGVNREEHSCSWSAMDSSMSVGMMDFRSGVGGGVSGLTRFDKTGKARFWAATGAQGAGLILLIVLGVLVFPSHQDNIDK